MSIQDVKKAADQRAAKACLSIRSLAKINPLFLTVQPNFKWYRKMAGLRNGDLKPKF